MDAETVGIMVVLFGMNYGILWGLHQKMNAYTTTLAIVCREHASNHGGEELRV